MLMEYVGSLTEWKAEQLTENAQLERWSLPFLRQLSTLSRAAAIAASKSMSDVPDKHKQQV